MIDIILFLIASYALYAIRSRVVLKKRIEELQRNQQRTRTKGNPSLGRNAEFGIVKDERYHANVLGLEGEISREQIKKRYRDLVSQYHPDKVAHLGPKLVLAAEEEMKAINASYQFFKKRFGIP